MLHFIKDNRRFLLVCICMFRQLKETLCIRANTEEKKSVKINQRFEPYSFCTKLFAIRWIIPNKRATPPLVIVPWGHPVPTQSR